jgi:heterotetrameric sarcosine oxidase gamma subunit
MIRRESAIVTDPVTVSDPQPTRLVRVEAFALDAAFAAVFGAAVGAPVPAVGKVTDAPAGPVIWAEPKVVLASGDAAALARALAEVAAVSDVAGAWRRIDLKGPGWRGRLMIDGLFDAEDPAFGTGCVAATMLHHAPVMLCPTADDAVAVYVAPSFAGDLHAALSR